VDTTVFQPRTAEQDDTQQVAPFRVLCIGTLHEVKGQRYLIEACRLLAERGVELECHLVGDGPDEAALKQQAAEAGIAEQIRFHGRRSRDEVAALIAEADLLAAPSVPTADGRREGIPVVLMEAMAGGVPVVASRLSGIPELVEHERCGLLVPPRDAAALAEAFARMQADPQLRRRLSAAGREKVTREFDVAANAELLAARFHAGAR
jgi:glycosyltransferase involved in cell wall biosynthesis